MRSADAPGPVAIGSVDDVRQLLHRRIDGQRRTKIIIALCFASLFIDAYDITSLSYVINDIKAHFGLDEQMTGLVSSSLNIGILAGTIVCGWLADRIGRASIFTIDMVCFVIAALAGAFAPNVPVLLVCRFIMGFGIGADLPVAIAMLAEFSARESSDKLGLQRIAALCPVWFVAAGLSAALLWLLFGFVHVGSTGNEWRISLALGAVPALAVVPLRARYVTESPLWLAEAGRWEKLIAMLRTSYGIEAVHRPPPTSDADVQVAPNAGSNGMAAPIGIGNIIAGASAWCYNALYFILPTLFAQALSLSQARIAGLIATFNLLCAVPGGILGVALLGRARLKRIGISFYGLQVVALGIVALFIEQATGPASWIVLAAVGVFFFAQGAGPGCFMLIYPALTSRSTGRGRSVALSRLATSITTALALYCAPIAFGIAPWLLLLIAAICPLGCFLLFRFGARLIEVR